MNDTFVIKPENGCDGYEIPFEKILYVKRVDGPVTFRIDIVLGRGEFIPVYRNNIGRFYEEWNAWRNGTEPMLSPQDSTGGAARRILSHLVCSKCGSKDVPEKFNITLAKDLLCPECYVEDVRKRTADSLNGVKS